MKSENKLILITSLLNSLKNFQLLLENGSIHCAKHSTQRLVHPPPKN